MRPVTDVGELRVRSSPLVPSPICPEPLSPQHRTVASDIRAQTWVSPTETSTAVVEVIMHVPLTQVPVMHAAPHRPQCALLVLRLTSHPLALAPSQSAKPVLHVATRHAPVVHVCVAVFARLHAPPQRPQCVSDVRRSVSQPFVAFASQLPKFVAHAPTAHAPAMQAAVPLATEHTRPHAPQCVGDAPRLVSHPFAALPSQSPKPALHVRTHDPDAQVAVWLLAA